MSGTTEVQMEQTSKQPGRSKAPGQGERETRWSARRKEGW